MHLDGYTFMVDAISKFHKSIYIHGWFYGQGDELKSISLSDQYEISSTSAVGQPHGGVESLGKNLGFKFQSIRNIDQLDLMTDVIFVTKRGKKITVTVKDLSDDRISIASTGELLKQFHSELIRRGCKNMLDIGGRDRSKIDRSMEFPEVNCTVLDIIDGTNVDIVGDAHEMSSLFDKNSFDATFSCSVFEHLAMPWRVVVEMNRIMKPGAIGLISTHQTIAMHDRPWDFFRFSDSTWDSLLNEKTGFRIIEKAMDGEQFVIPFVLHDGKQNAEQAAGFEGSAVLFEKVCEPTLDWPVKISDIIHTQYPTD